jgi:hypothetical protein
VKLPPGALLLSVLGLAFLLRLPFLSLPLTVDEGSYAYVAFWWLRGETLYDRVWIDRPQGIFIAVAFILRLLGGSPEAIRLGVALLNLVTTALVWLVAGRLSGLAVALTAAAFYAVLSAHPRIEGVVLNTEIVMLLPATLSLWLLLIALERPRPAAWLAGAGAAAGAAFLVSNRASLPSCSTSRCWRWRGGKRGRAMPHARQRWWRSWRARRCPSRCPSCMALRLRPPGTGMRWPGTGWPTAAWRPIHGESRRGRGWRTSSLCGLP